MGREEEVTNPHKKASDKEPGEELPILIVGKTNTEELEMKGAIENIKKIGITN